MSASILKIIRSCKILAAFGSLTVLLIFSSSCTTRSNAQGGSPPPFVKACANESEGASCSFNTTDRQFKEGSCTPAPRRPGTLVCMPPEMASKARGRDSQNPTTADRSSKRGLPLSVENCDCEIEHDLQYGSANGSDAKFTTLDIYHRGDSGNQPVLVFVHGGGWVTGDKSNITMNKNMVNSFLDSGYVVAAVNFRLIEKKRNSKVKYTDMAGDIARSIKWLSQNVQEYGGDPQFFVLLGYSSGAHMVALVGTDTRYLEDQDLSLDIIRGVSAWDVHAYDIPEALKLMKGTALDERIGSMKAFFGDTEKEQEKASPVFFVDNGASVPFQLLSAGIKEGNKQSISQEMTIEFETALINAGHTAEHHHYENSSHKDLPKDYGTSKNDVREQVERFLIEVKNASSTGP